MERPFHDALSDTLYTADVCRLLNLRAGLCLLYTSMGKQGVPQCGGVAHRRLGGKILCGQAAGKADESQKQQDVYKRQGEYAVQKGVHLGKVP